MKTAKQIPGSRRTSPSSSASAAHLQSFTVSAGNVIRRPGHRHDCAEIHASWTVQAESREDALRAVRAIVAKDGTSPPVRCVVSDMRITFGELSPTLNVAEVTS